jgi:hypothetical protein
MCRQILLKGSLRGNAAMFGALARGAKHGMQRRHHLHFHVKIALPNYIVDSATAIKLSSPTLIAAKRLTGIYCWMK